MSKLERSREVKEEQSSNILLISITRDVSKLERSSVVRAEQPENMPCFQEDIDVTFEVSKLERSREVKEEQELNIPLMSVTCEVLRCSNPFILIRDRKARNHPTVVVGRKSRNEASNTAVRMVVLGDLKVPAQAGKCTKFSFFFSPIPHVVPSRSSRRVS